MWNKRHQQKQNEILKEFSGIDITLEELIALRIGAAQITRLPRDKQLLAHHVGQNRAKIRGRGIEFDATREYQSGDDIRRMAWRVTARSLKPHIKVYHEEKERPVWLLVDLSPSLYFGTRTMFKSVRAIRQAAYLGWQHLRQRERIGAIIATPEKISIHKPNAREREFLFVLKTLAQYSTHRPDYTARNCLQLLLQKAQENILSGSTLFIVSDFLQFDLSNQKLIMHLARRAQVKLIFVYDVFEAEPPPAYQYVLTDSQKTAVFNMENAQNRQRYQQQFQIKRQELITFARQQQINLQILRTDQDLMTEME